MAESRERPSVVHAQRLRAQDETVEMLDALLERRSGKLHFQHLLLMPLLGYTFSSFLLFFNLNLYFGNVLVLELFAQVNNFFTISVKQSNASSIGTGSESFF